MASQAPDPCGGPGSEVPSFLVGIPDGVTRCLLAAGVTELRDLAGLTEADVVAMTGTECSQQMRALRSQAHREVEAEAAKPLEGPIKRIFPTGGPGAPTLQGGAQKAARVGGTGPTVWQPPTVRPGVRAAGCAEGGDMVARARAADCALEVLRVNVHSSALYPEIQQAQAAGRAEEWYAKYRDVLSKRFEAQGMMHAVRTWRR